MIHYQPGMTLDSVEQGVIEQAFKFYRGNKTHTADSLQMSVRTLDAKLEKYNEQRVKRELEERVAAEQRQEELRRARGLFSPHAGLRVEPTAQAPTEHSMPMPESVEVQEMLQRPPSKGRIRRDGRNV